MNLIKNIRFYWDNISRFESNQLYYLIIHRIKARFSGLIKYDIFRSIPGNFLITRDTFKTRINTIIRMQSGRSIWDLTETDNIQEIQYFRELKSQIQRNLNSPEKLWLIELEDSEVANNYDRFHLFAEAFVALQLTSTYVMNFLRNYIQLYDKKSKKCWNGFNITIRIINWIKILDFYCDYFDEKEWNIVQKSLYKHYSLLKNRLEKHIPGNHVLYQYFVLWLVSNLFPEWEKGKEWDSTIISEIKKQFLPGGLHFELGYHYHVQTTIVVLYWFLMSQRMGKEIPVNVFETIRNAMENVYNFLLPDGTIPMVGDNCFCFFHQQLDEDIKNIRALSSKLNISLSTSEIGVSNISNRYLISQFSKSKLILDIGELGYRSNPGHGHSDLLSFIYFQRAPIFIDPGTRRYSNLEEDMVLKKSFLHNTLSINSQSQAELGSFFRWAYLPDQINFNFKGGKGEHILSGSYCGFKQIGPYVHNRKIVHKNDYLEIEDYVPGKRILNLELNFILHPGISIANGGKKLLLKNSEYTWTISFVSEQDFTIKILPTNVYLNYDESEPSSRINLFFSKIKLPFKIKTILLAD